MDFTKTGSAKTKNFTLKEIMVAWTSKVKEEIEKLGIALPGRPCPGVPTAQ